MTHGILPEAREEFDQAVQYLEEQVAGLGDEFRGEVIATLQEILDDPESGSWFEEEMMYRSVHRFRYVVI